MMGFQKFLRPFGSKRAELERKKLEKFLRSVGAQALRGVSLRSRHELLKDDLCVELAGYLVDDYHYSPEEAIEVLYTSETFERLQEEETGLYYQSPGYVYSFLQNELKTARVA